MSGIPSDIYNEIRMVLLDSNLLDTNQQIQAIFVDNRISMWRNRLPEASSRVARIEATVSFLHNKANVNGENGLILLLAVLLDRVDMAEATHQQLVDIMAKLGQPISSLKIKPPSPSNISIGSIGGDLSGNVAGRDITQGTHHHYYGPEDTEQAIQRAKWQVQLEKLEAAIQAQEGLRGLLSDEQLEAVLKPLHKQQVMLRERLGLEL